MPWSHWQLFNLWNSVPRLHMAFAMLTFFRWFSRNSYATVTPLCLSWMFFLTVSLWNFSIYCTFWTTNSNNLKWYFQKLLIQRNYLFQILDKKKLLLGDIAKTLSWRCRCPRISTRLWDPALFRKVQLNLNFHNELPAISRQTGQQTNGR